MLAEAEANPHLPIARGLGRADEILWPLRSSGELFELRYGKALTETSRNPGQVPVYGSNGQTGNHDVALFPGPGVVIGRKGMGHLGVEWSPHDYWVIDTAYALHCLTDIDLRFAYYLIRHVGVDHLKHGTSNPSLTRDAFAAQLFPVPPVDAQRAIAEVLGALDDKIAANDRLAARASDLADAEFALAVRDVPLADETFADIADVGGGGTPKTKVEEYWTGDIPWATPTDVTALPFPYLADTSRHISEEGLAACASKLYPAGSILMTSRATIGAFAINQRPTAVNQGFIVVNATEATTQLWLFHEMRWRVPEFISHANGATFLELSRGRFKQFHVHRPSHAKTEEFDAIVRPLHVLAAQTMQESAQLAATRDELLPLLMSGRVRVRDAEKIVEEAV